MFLRRPPALIAAALTTAVLAGCGGKGSTPGTTVHDVSSGSTPATRTSPGVPSNSGGSMPSRKHLLVYFKEVYGVDPLASYLTVYDNGQAVAVMIEGGRDGAKVRKFRLSGAQLGKLARLVHDTRLHNTSCCNNLNGWIFWVITGRKSARLQQSGVPRASRPLVNMLNAITQANTIY